MRRQPRHGRDIRVHNEVASSAFEAEDQPMAEKRENLTRDDDRQERPWRPSAAIVGLSALLLSLILAPTWRRASTVVAASQQSGVAAGDVSTANRNEPVGFRPVGESTSLLLLGSGLVFLGRSFRRLRQN